MRYKYWKSDGRHKNKSGKPYKGWFIILNTGDYHKCLSINNWTDTRVDVHLASEIGINWIDKEPPECIKKQFENLKVANL